MYTATWQCILMRTSSRPVDMVFSAMNMFGVTLDPSTYKPSERLRATVDLARAILQQGGRANWLGLSLKAPLSRNISTFPEFPETTVAGRAFIKTANGDVDVQSLMDGSYMVSNARDPPLPKGTMDKSGCLSLTRRAAMAVRPSATSDVTDLSPRILVTTADDIEWHLVFQEWGSTNQTTPTNPPARKTFGIVLGIFIQYYPGQSNAGSKYRGMLVEESRSGQSHVLSYFTLDLKWREWILTLKERSFVVGGPESMEGSGEM